MKTIHEYRGYVFTIEFVAEDPAFVVDFPDIQEIITSGSSLNEAFHNACEALDLHIDSLHKLGEPLPKIRTKLQLVEC
jgi:predicted RNase H-like HicB family nuclease